MNPKLTSDPPLFEMLMRVPEPGPKLSSFSLTIALA
jgi:hypothetical protein